MDFVSQLLSYLDSEECDDLSYVSLDQTENLDYIQSTSNKILEYKKDSDLLRKDTLSVVDPTLSSAPIQAALDRRPNTPEAESLQQSLNLNRELQTILLEKLKWIDQEIARNIEHTRIIREVIHNKKQNTYVIRDSDLGLRSRRRLHCPGTTVLRRLDCIEPTVLSKFKIAHRYEIWKQVEKMTLDREVLREYHRTTLSEAPMPHIQDFEESEWESDKDSVTYAHSKEPKNTPPLPDDLLSHASKFDWNRIAQKIPGTTPNECRIRFMYHHERLLNREPFSSSERDRLIKIIERHPERNWVVIAKEHGHQRLPFQIFCEYLSMTERSHAGKKWTPEEDALLLKLVDSYNARNWVTIAGHLNGRNRNQVNYRYNTLMNDKPFRKGRWETNELERLEEAIEIYGQGNWKRIAQYVGTRSGVQCRERYMNVTAPSVNSSPFTRSEHDRLIHLVLDIGTRSWSHMAKLFGNGRTDNQLMREYRKLYRLKVSGKAFHDLDLPPINIGSTHS